MSLLQKTAAVVARCQMTGHFYGWGVGVLRGVPEMTILPLPYQWSGSLTAPDFFAPGQTARGPAGIGKGKFCELGLHVNLSAAV